jgi:hypothetical protein
MTISRGYLRRLAVVAVVLTVVLGTVPPTPIAETEPNDDRSTADLVAAGTTEPANLTQDDTDWFAVDATRGEAVELTVARPATESGSLRVSLISPSGDTVVGATAVFPGDPGTFGDVAEANGTYYLEVTGQSGRYNVSAAKPANDAFEPNEQQANATRLFDNPRGPISGRLTANDVDHFAINADAGDPINVSFTLPPDAESSVNVKIRNASGSQLAESVVVPGETGNLSATASAAGTYDLETREGDGPYAAGVTVAGETYGLPNDRFEPNENASDPADVPLGEVDNLAMVDDDRDYFAVDADAGDRIEASIAFNDSANNLTLALYDPNETLVDESATAADREAVSFTAQQGGTHYLAVTGEPNAVGTYSLSTAVIGSIDLAVGPGGDTVQPGNATTYNLTLAGATAGVGSLDVTLNASNGTVATLTGATAVDGDSQVTTTPDGTSLTLNVTNASIAGGTSVQLGRVDVQTAVEGETTVNVSGTPTVRTPGGIAYPIDRVQGTTVSVSNDTGAALFPDGIPGSSGNQPPTDPDDDGLFEDFNGDGQFTFVDVIDFVFAIGAIQSADLSSAQTAAIDFDNSGGVDFVDVVDLVFQLG